MAKRKLSKKKLTIVMLGFTITLSALVRLGLNIAKKIKYELRESKKVVLKDESQTRYRVYIDPGHGGHDIGTTNKNNDGYEKNLAFDISTIVVEKLSRYSNVDIIVSRFDDRYVTLEDRVRHANSTDSDYFIAIHLNADPNSYDTHGVETYYSEGNKKEIDGSDEFAKFIQNNIIKTTGAKDRGVKRSNFMVTKFTKMPAVLIECGFLTNNNEKNKISTKMYQDKIAQGVVDGLVEYIGQ